MYQSIRHYLLDPERERAGHPWLMPTTMIELVLTISAPMSKCHQSPRPIQPDYRHSRFLHARPHPHRYLDRLPEHRSWRRNRHHSIHRSTHQIYWWRMRVLVQLPLGAMLADCWLVLVVRCRTLCFWQHWPHRAMWEIWSLRQGYHQFSKFVCTRN